MGNRFDAHRSAGSHRQDREPLRQHAGHAANAQQRRPRAQTPAVRKTASRPTETCCASCPMQRRNRGKTVIRLPSFEKVRNDAVLYAHANRVLHLETNPGNARALVQAHGGKDLWLNPPALPLSDPRDGLRVRHAVYARAPLRVRRCAHPRLRNDSLLGEHHARLFRRLHVLLHHGARRPHHSESLRRIDPRRGGEDSRQRAGFHWGDL